MLKICVIVDKEDTAIDRLSQGMKPYMNGYDYEVVAVHPKRPSPEQLARFEEVASQASIIDFQYFRTALMLLDRYAWLKDKKTILTHHNPYSITESDWSQFDIVVANNQTIHKQLQGSEYIFNTIDTDFWTFNTNWQPNDSVIMVANRIEAKKGIAPVAKACGELGIKLILVGSISEPSYFHEIIQGGTVEFHEKISDEKLRELYYQAGLHICNSRDNFESGTLPMLEAMCCGVPVLTRDIGHVPELNNGKNMYLNQAQPEDEENIKTLIQDIFADKKKMAEVREAGWSEAKNRSHERRAYLYKRLYRRLIDDDPVSVIVPIANKPATIRKNIEAINSQTHRNIEIIVVDDGDNKALIDSLRPFTPHALVYLTNNQGDYGLARARNKAIIEATSDILVFCDERVIMDSGAIAEFSRNIGYQQWVYGDKGYKKDFVENFSCVYRQELIYIGMFCERINEYGGMSQEIRARIRKNGWQTPFVETAKAKLEGKSSNRWRRKDEIIRMKNKLYLMGLD